MSETRISPGASLEQQFGFTDAAFQRYMNLGTISQTAPAELTRMASAMAKHEHPIVRYAAGWAYAEEGLHRSDVSTGESKPPDIRLDALHKANVLWATTEPYLADLQQQSSNEKLAANIWGIRLRAQQARAYVPNMQLIARARGGEQLSHESIIPAHQRTDSALTDLGTLILQHVALPQHRHEIVVRYGAGDEVLSGLLLHRALRASHIIMAASVRQNNCLPVSRRTHLFAKSVVPSQQNKLIRIGGVGHQPDTRLYMYISPAKDLFIPPNKSIWRTLKIATAPEDSPAVRPEERTHVDALALALGKRLTSVS
ncbi:MAG TPA: hypothetical protein VLE73_02670 [Candidatus Saccharimonadales bacterium]|nr:hypothetical protein [Candidatus Saccharimonadales bacterium]